MGSSRDDGAQAREGWEVDGYDTQNSVGIACATPLAGSRVAGRVGLASTQGYSGEIAGATAE